MAYNQELAQRILSILGPLPGLDSKKMFGGVGYLLNGNMACGVHGERLIVRLDKAVHAEAMARPHTHPFDLTGKPMAGWLMVDPEGCESDEDLADWVWQGVKYARTLPPR